MTVRGWDGGTYDRVGLPQLEWGRVVLERLPLAGDETVVDAGCGSGRVTELLLERLPTGRVIAVDGSASMLAAARQRLGGDPRVEFLEANLLGLDLEGRRVDAVLSTATFHWIKDHRALFTRLRSVLRPGGHLVAQCGGQGNLEGLLVEVEVVMREPPYAAAFVGWRDPHRFAGAEKTAELLQEVGFAEAHAWLADAPVQPPEPAVFLESVILGAHCERLPDEQRSRFVADVMERLTVPVTADYVRLNIDAIA